MAAHAFITLGHPIERLGMMRCWHNRLMAEVATFVFLKWHPVQPKVQRDSCGSLGEVCKFCRKKGYTTSLQSQCKGVRHSPQSPHFVDLILLRVLQGWLSACVWNKVWIPVAPSPTVFVQSQGQWLKEKFGEKTSKCLFLYTGVFVTFGKSDAWRSHFWPYCIAAL